MTITGVAKIRETVERLESNSKIGWIFTKGANFRLRAIIVAFIIAALLSLHYLTPLDAKFQHAIYRMLLYLPLILGAFWFGLKGALLVSLSMLLLYMPFMLNPWQGLNFTVFDFLLEGVLYFLIAFILGFLADSEKKAISGLFKQKTSPR
ncbi:MAG: hypothetical protein JRD68_07570 [Deltaproteobacteria bacterium]|nr:hypothetical protein [Deltaproteobacteria bacterium]